MAPRFVRNLGKWNVAPTYKFWTIDIMLKSRPYAELYFNGATQILKKVLMMEHCPFRVMNPWHWIWNLLGAESKSRPSLCLAVSWGVKRHLISFLLWADTWLEQSLGTFMAETWVYFFQSCLRKKCAVVVVRSSFPWLQVCQAFRKGWKLKIWHYRVSSGPPPSN